MGMECNHMSNSDGTCQLSWEEIGMDDRNGEPILLYTNGEEGCDPITGTCDAESAEFPGDICQGYQPDLAGDYCERCGEYLGYGDDEDDDNYEESECICND